MKTNVILLFLGILFCGCSTFTKIEISDTHYIRIPSKAVDYLAYDQYSEVHYSGGVTYCFTDKLSGAQVVIANHPRPSFYFVDHLTYKLRCLQLDSIEKQHLFTWQGVAPQLHRAHGNIEKYDLGNQTIYWRAMLITHPSFAPNCGWYFIGYDNVPKREVRLYEKIFRLRKYSAPLKKRSPWGAFEPLLAPDKIDNIYKEYFGHKL